MQLQILLDKNPYFQNTANANRWRTLIDGLNQLGVNIKLIIYEGYSSKNERNKLNRKDSYNGVEYVYLTKGLNDNLWKRRWHKYVKSWFVYFEVKWKFLQLIKKDLDAIIWTSGSYLCFKIAHSVKKKYPNRILFLEMSEFLDNHKNQQGNILQRKLADKRQTIFRTKSFIFL